MDCIHEPSQVKCYGLRCSCACHWLPYCHVCYGALCFAILNLLLHSTSTTPGMAPDIIADDIGLMSELARQQVYDSAWASTGPLDGQKLLT